MDPHTTTTVDAGCGGVSYMISGYALALATWARWRQQCAPPGPK